MGAKKKEIKTVLGSELDNGRRSQSIDKIYVSQTSKQTEVIDSDVDVAVQRIVEILRSEIKVI